MERRVAVEGCHNFRDLGGYPTRDGRRLRWRRLFRADALHSLTPSDVTTLRGEIGLGEVVDLRSSAELEADGRGPLADEAIRFHHLPLIERTYGDDVSPPADFDLGDFYFDLLDFAREPLARVLTTLARTPAPAVFHCSAGKDRTGVVSALLLGLLGVDDELIVADYAATREALAGIEAKLKASRGYEDMWKELPPESLHANPETMQVFLVRLGERYGGIADYARGIGVSEADLGGLRERMLEP